MSELNESNAKRSLELYLARYNVNYKNIELIFSGSERYIFEVTLYKQVKITYQVTTQGEVSENDQKSLLNQDNEKARATLEEYFQNKKISVRKIEDVGDFKFTDGRTYYAFSVKVKNIRYERFYQVSELFVVTEIDFHILKEYIPNLYY